MSELAPEKAEGAVALSEALNHPLFNPHLRDLVRSMVERPGVLSIDYVVAALGMDRQAIAEHYVAEAIGLEVLRIRELEDAKARGLN
ncbi:hypothetical protein EN851_11340 [Mesorhizobium sp. M8A.F.Ca.ET.208.01.1.1]|uniref:hypothetical protein n=1 Tax=unclassified Mesorhizobium TaxID=325217 RepID=UPI00109402BE|nr:MULTISPECIES: hypothetical protein [unclassified Mesorhizobium]TGQ92186.1 hypothetical protein EN851_11340 [Mesorhizobium sp. M8A.F.Ca.ET.208.01.1.1]TGT52086.1 hypothetical protein EN810_11330 [Mesorhizobium sp. M8A.F.Ca.ET.167.01.1.1]